MASSPMPRARQQQPREEEAEGAEDVKTEGLLKSRKAVLPSEIRRRERSTEDPWRGRGDQDLGICRTKSHSHVREGEAEDPVRERGRTRWDETQHISHLQATENRCREQEMASHISKMWATSHTQPRVTHSGPVYTTVDPQDQRKLQHQSHSHQEVRQGHHESLRDDHVSVSQLRHSYMESTTTPPSSRRNES